MTVHQEAAQLWSCGSHSRPFQPPPLVSGDEESRPTGDNTDSAPPQPQEQRSRCQVQEVSLQTRGRGTQPHKPQPLCSDIASPQVPSSLTTNPKVLSTYHSRKVSTLFQMSAFIFWNEGTLRARHTGWQIRPVNRLALWVGSDTLLLR